MLLWWILKGAKEKAARYKAAAKLLRTVLKASRYIAVATLLALFSVPPHMI
jgi:hypothetical protein